ncbi:hypothetical protein ACFWVM_28840 [Nocardia fluminea]|uniref:hypothetical protein n=1 Tax=Nocardia fluminea TaxID=134984 RepID=UPI0036513096
MTTEIPSRTVGGFTLRGDDCPRWTLGPLVQLPIEELFIFLRAVLECEQIESVHWRAFTLETPEPDGSYRYHIEDPDFRLSGHDEPLSFGELQQMWGDEPNNTTWQLVKLFANELVDGEYAVSMLSDLGVNVEVSATPDTLLVEPTEPDY